MSRIVKHVDITRTSGTSLKIQAPTKMTIPAIAKCLLDYEKAMESPIDFNRDFPGVTLFDGLVALQRVYRDRYGLVTPHDSQRPFKITVQTASGPEECYLSRMTVPFLDSSSWVQATYSITPTGVDFRVTAQVKGKHEEELKESMQALQDYLDRKSIYTGNATHVNFKFIWDEQTEFSPKEHMPRFINETALQTNPDDLIFPEHIERLCDATIYSVIRNTDALRKMGIPIKRGVLLAGQYGVGKTMLANAIAHTCLKNGWTFILCSDARDYPYALAMAKRHQPAVVFCEDIDRLVKGQSDQERNAEIDMVLNTIDGVEYKRAQIVSIFTTNDVDAIHPAFLRPGRIDTHVNITLPDAGAAERLAERFGDKYLDPKADLEQVGEVLAGQTPAQIKEVIERAKLYSLSRNGKLEENSITSEDIIFASRGMEEHRRLCMPRRPDNRPVEIQVADKIAAGLGNVGKALIPILEEMADLDRPAQHRSSSSLPSLADFDE